MSRHWGPERKSEIAKHVLCGEEGRLNAGEVQLELRWECSTERDAEWYAFCHRRPNFKFFPSVVLDLRELYHDAVEIKAMLSTVLWVSWCIPTYIMRWECPLLSSSVLIWWWLACLRPMYVMPTLFLWPLLMLQLLRKESWQKAILVHERTCPLNETGFNSLAHFRNPKRMEVWLNRLLGLMGLRVCDQAKLVDLSREVMCGGKPLVSFKELVVYLKEANWVHNCGKDRECPKGHTPEFLGHVSGDCERTCEHPRGCRFLKLGSRWDDRSHYFCDTCGIHICEPCVASMARPPSWTRMPAELVPQWLETMLVSVEEPLHRARRILERLLETCIAPFRKGPNGGRSSQRVSLVLGALSVVALGISLLLNGPLDGLMLFLVKAALIVGGSVCLLIELRFIRRLYTRFRATSDHEEALLRRRQVPELRERWAFFTPTTDS